MPSCGALHIAVEATSADATCLTTRSAVPWQSALPGKQHVSPSVMSGLGCSRGSSAAVCFLGPLCVWCSIALPLHAWSMQPCSDSDPSSRCWPLQWGPCMHQRISCCHGCASADCPPPRCICIWQGTGGCQCCGPCLVAGSAPGVCAAAGSARRAHGVRILVSTTMCKSDAGKSPDAFLAWLLGCTAMSGSGPAGSKGCVCGHAADAHCCCMQCLATPQVVASQVEMSTDGDDHACRRYALQAIDAQAQVDALRERLREVVGAQQGAWVQHQRWARLCEQPYTMLHK